MDLLGCAEIRPRLAAYYDGELSVEGQIAIDTHVMGCAACAGDARRLEAIGRALRARTVSRKRSGRHGRGSRDHRGQPDERRARSVGQGSGRPAVRGYASGVAALGAVTSTACCILLIAATMYFTGPGRTDSLAAIMTAMASPGLQREPRAARSEHPSAPRSPGGDRTGDAGRPTSWRQWRI